MFEGRDLLTAFKKGNLEEADRLIAAGKDINFIIWPGWSILYGFLLEKPTVALLEELLKRGANPNIANTMDGRTPLFIAIKNNDLATINALLKAGANPNVADRRQTVLEFAIGEVGTDPLIIQSLLRAGATPTNEALEDAFDHDAIEIMRMLLAAGANPNMMVELPAWNGEPDEIPLLLRAVRGRKHVVVRILLAAGADPNMLTILDGETTFPLLEAVEQGDRRMIQILLKGGADVNPRGAEGIVLAAAAENGNEHILRMLASARRRHVLSALRTRRRRAARRNTRKNRK
jgi:ankyrin repeat protein